MLPRVEIAKRIPACSPFFACAEGHSSTSVGKAVPINIAGMKKFKKLINNGSHRVGSFSKNIEAIKLLISGENITNIDIASGTYSLETNMNSPFPSAWRIRTRAACCWSPKRAAARR